MENSYHKIKGFFLGKWYPIVTFAFIIFGFISGLEAYTVLLSAILTAIAIISTLNIKPMLFYMLTFMLQFNARHLPMKPYYSNYYYTGHRIYIFVATALIIVASVLIYLVRSKVLRFVAWRKIPLFIPLVLFCSAMLANGLFVDGTDFMDFVWGCGQVLVYLVIYLLCYLGLRNENKRELLDYFSHLVTLMSWVIIVEVVWFVITDDMSFAAIIDARSIALGVGNCNIVGVHAAMLVPANFYGFAKGKRPYLSLVTALMVYAVAMMSTSRNAMLFGTIYLVCSFIFCAFFGDKKKESVKIILIISAIIAVFALIFRNQVSSVIQIYLDRGMGNNGRYPLWERAYQLFLESPIFGKGFYSIDLTTPNSFDKISFDLVPDFAHNTIFELLGATGIVGFVSYSIYRISTFVVAFKKPTAEKTMLILSALYIAFGSLLDNFIFQIFTPVLYTVTMVMLVLLNEENAEHTMDVKNKSCRTRF